ncbi:hypothetical protein [Curtobacterium sp. DN_7.5]|uniref:hypothetical protein n=1 Tax=Curtobacterium sp. DN_7.5 TaxID=3049047 RepID=UPI001F5AFC8C|nr:hypothetical protein [Curtobacterium sp. DN_7.5]
MALVAALAGCTTTGATKGPTATSSDRPTARIPSIPSTDTAASSTASAASAASDEDRVATFCAANAAAARAVRGTVAEDIAARRAQAEATRELLPVLDASAQVTAGAKKFAAAADETVTILRNFPPESKVSDVGTDPRFLRSVALQAAASDEDYRAFLEWVLKTCAAAY